MFDECVHKPLNHALLLMVLFNDDVDTALQDARLQAGDQLMAVNGHSLIDVAQET